MLDKDGYFVKETPWECTERLCQWDPGEEHTCGPGCPFYDDRLERAMDDEHILALRQIIRDSNLAPEDPCVGIRVDHGSAGDYIQYEVKYRDGGKVIVYFYAVDELADEVSADWCLNAHPLPCKANCVGCHYNNTYYKCYYAPPKKEEESMEDKDGPA